MTDTNENLYLILYHRSNVAIMFAEYASCRLSAKTPQEAVDKLLFNEAKNLWAVSDIKVYEEIKEPSEGWKVHEEEMIDQGTKSFKSQFKYMR